jgi:hypothetical protein
VSFYVGLDLGQSSDYTALAVLENVSTSEADDAALDHEIHLRHLARYALRTPYTQIAERVAGLMAKLREHSEPFGQDASLLVDNTGVGQAVSDVLRERGLHFKAVTLTGGSRVTRGDRAGEWRVPKADVVDALVVPFQAGTLKVARGLELWPTLRTELLNFRRKINPATAHASYEHWRESDHDDLVLAAALAAWGAQRFPSTTPPDVRSLATMSRPSYWSRAGGSSLGRRSWRV